MHFIMKTNPMKLQTERLDKMPIVSFSKVTCQQCCPTLIQNSITSQIPSNAVSVTGVDKPETKAKVQLKIQDTEFKITLLEDTNFMFKTIISTQV